jgi:hypothetical protein
MAEPKPLTATEEKELKRVFNTLCNYQRKLKLWERAAQLKDLREKLAKDLRGQGTQGPTDEVIENQLAAARNELSEIEREQETLDSDPNRKIKVLDLSECLRILGRSVTRKEVEDMIWEVDENLDGMVDWEELW